MKTGIFVKSIKPIHCVRTKRFDPNISIFVDILTKQNEQIIELLDTLIHQHELIIQILEQIDSFCPDKNTLKEAEDEF